MSQKTCKSEYRNRIWIKKQKYEDRLESEVQETILQEPKAITRTETSDQSIQTEEVIRVSILEKIKSNSKILINVFNEEKSQLNSKNSENTDCNLLMEQIMGKPILLTKKEEIIQF